MTQSGDRKRPKAARCAARTASCDTADRGTESPRRYIPIAKTADVLETMGVQRPHLETVRRWAKLGVHGVKLETFMVGGRRHTSVGAIERFIDAAPRGAA